MDDSEQKYLLVLDPDGWYLPNGDGDYLPGVKKIWVGYAEKVGILPIPKRPGYKFNGWAMTVPDDEEWGYKTVWLKSGDPYPWERNTIYHATWLQKAYDINWVWNDGTGQVDVWQMKYDDELGLRRTDGQLPYRSRWGYDFLGWFSSRESESAIQATPNTQVKGDMTWYGRWRKKVLTVSFASNCDETYPDPKVEHGKKIGELPLPTKRGYRFLGWFYNEKKVDEKLTVFNDMVLEAKWDVVVYEISYNYDGYEPSETEHFETKYTVESPTYAPPPLSWEQKIFSHWQPEAIQHGSVGNVKFFAKWNTRYVKADYTNPDTKIEAQPATFPTKVFAWGERHGEFPEVECPGWFLLGWKEDGKPDEERVDEDYLMKDDTLFVSVWARNKYTLTFDANDGYVRPSQKEVTYGKEVDELPTPTREGYRFDGWFDHDGMKVDEHTTYQYLDDITLVAKWVANTYEVRFNPNGGEGEMNVQVLDYDKPAPLNPCQFRKMETVTFDDNVEVDGTQTTVSERQAFTGWALSSNGEVRFQDGDTVSSENVGLNGLNIYAKWGYATVDAPNLKDRTNYRFLGWSHDRFAVAPEYVGGLHTTVVQFDVPTVLFAVWVQLYFAIQFNPWGGKVDIIEKSVPRGKPIGDMPMPVKEGYVFKGWFTSPISGNQIGNATVVDRDMVAVAQWKKLDAEEQEIQPDAYPKGMKRDGDEPEPEPEPEPIVIPLKAEPDELGEPLPDEVDVFCRWYTTSSNQTGTFTTDTGRVCQRINGGDRVCYANATTHVTSSLYPLLADPSKQYVRIQIVPGRDMSYDSDQAYIFGDLPIFQRRRHSLKRWFLQKAGGMESLGIAAETGEPGVGDDSITDFGTAIESGDPEYYSYDEVYINWTDFKERFSVQGLDEEQYGFSFYAEEEVKEKPESSETGLGDEGE